MLSYYLANKPMNDKANNFIQVFNEIVILLATWYMFLFTEYVSDPVIRYDFGEWFKYLLIFNVGINVCVLIWTLLAQIAFKIKICYLKRQARKKV